MKKYRDGNYELLRIIAMLCVVLYHLLHFYLIPLYNCSVLKAMCIPLHQGVILFVLISGYYGIHFSLQKIVKFIFPVLFYYIFLSICEYYRNQEVTLVDCFLFISRSPYWFVRSYLWLLLTSPIINTFLHHSNRFLRIYMLFTLGAISFWMGITGGDPSLDGGKNLLHFFFLYGLGYEIRINSCSCVKLHNMYIFLLYLLVNLLIVLLFSVSLERFYYSGMLYDLCFKYNSAFLTANACALFIIFGRIKIDSLIIKNIAASCFPVYLITEHQLTHKIIIEPCVKLCCFGNNALIAFGYTMCFSLFLFMVCVIIDIVSVRRLTNIISGYFSSTYIEFKAK